MAECWSCGHEVRLIQEKWWHFDPGQGASVECYHRASKDSPRCGCKKAGIK